MANRSHCHSLHFLSLIQGMNEGHHYLRCHFLLHSVQNLFWICIALGFCAASVSIASAGKFLAKNYTLKPKDLSTLNINIKTLNKIHLAADQVREKITEQDIPAAIWKDQWQTEVWKWLHPLISQQMFQKNQEFTAEGLWSEATVGRPG